MPAPPNRKALLAAYRREALLRAATRVFGRHEFEAATMERIAREAQVAKGTPYLYFPSKQRIYAAALCSGLAGLDERTRQALDGVGHLREAIPAFVTARIDYFLEHRDFFRMYVGAVARQITSPKPRASEFQEMADRQTRRLERAIARAVARREIRRVDPGSTAVAILDLTRGVVARGMVAPDRADLAADVAFLSELVWKGLRAQTSRRRRDAPARGATVRQR